ncbi:hypothetical protein [Polaribacter aquimarinus]|uniref:Uncharacterized protein n=1 Tax=Polaribacter aquimarinus TaxID=2100726 RepID=A0A2U2JAL6_9FLAO|nr:hypothetical protein [Polaribacter aquimarinus]PWG05373.1 hypothetical protein DIS07_09075 [Polaribacter aquimarinus]
MNNKEHINKEIQDTFKVLENIEKIEVNHFFKHKVLQRMNAEKVEKQTIFSWFTPQLQLVTLSIILLINCATVFYVFSDTETSSSSTIEEFAQEYSLQSNSNSFLN